MDAARRGEIDLRTRGLAVSSTDDEGTEMATAIQLLGVSFKTAPLALRESLALDEVDVRRSLTAIRAAHPEVEALVLSTCNRTELYVAGTSLDVTDAWHAGLSAGEREGCPALAAGRYQMRGRAAARHLFRVASGLESAVLGDNEIVSQLRSAARLSDECGVLGPRLRHAVDHALRASKQARSTTAIGSGGAGIGSCVATLVAAAKPKGCRVLLLGAGEAAATIARELRKRVDPDLVIANRSPRPAGLLADRHGGAVVALEDLRSAAGAAEVIVAATAAPQPLITKQLVDEVRAAVPGWDPLVIDTGVPRNVEPGCGLQVTTMDSLADRARRVSRVRAAAVAGVERCIDEGLARWHQTETRRLIRHGIEALDVSIDAVPAAS